VLSIFVGIQIQPQITTHLGSGNALGMSFQVTKNRFFQQFNAEQGFLFFCHGVASWARRGLQCASDYTMTAYGGRAWADGTGVCVAQGGRRATILAGIGLAVIRGAKASVARDRRSICQ
jgi:hypothetical protein